MAQVIFIFEGNNTIIQCNENDSMQNIIHNFVQSTGNEGNILYYLYNGNIINKELTFNEIANEFDKNNKRMNVIVYKIDEDKNEIISKDIICPTCKEIILLKIKNFKINLNGCKNNHNTDNILLNKYEETQKIDISKIICDICNKNNKGNTHNNEFYICNTCNKNICPLCKSYHDKNHNIINYDDKNYICNKHNDPFNKYCKTCNENICIICENKHKDHNILDFKDILIDKDDILKTQENLKNIIDDLKYKINILKEILDRIINLCDIYYKINNDVIKNYNMNKRNYHKIQIIYDIKNDNEKLIKDISNIINNDKIFEIYGFPNNKYTNNNGEIYIGEMKNNLKDGKGIFYFNKDDKFERKKYEGDFKNDKREGKGTIYWNDGDRYEGDWKNDKIEGKGIFYWNDGDKYDGDFKNDKREGKGIYYYISADKYEGEWKNDKKEGKGIMHFNNGNR